MVLDKKLEPRCDARRLPIVKHNWLLTVVIILSFFRLIDSPGDIGDSLL